MKCIKDVSLWRLDVEKSGRTESPLNTVMAQPQVRHEHDRHTTRRSHAG
jgi:hypothetical protein